MSIYIRPESVSVRKEDFEVTSVSDEVFVGGEPGVLVIPGFPVQGWPIILYGQDQVVLRHIPSGESATITGYAPPTGGHVDQGEIHKSIGPKGSHVWQGLGVMGFLHPEEIRG